MNPILNTLEEYQTVRGYCRDIFLAKVKDYGTSWRVLRPISIVDQLYIKAWRIRSIQESDGVQQISDSIEMEFRAIVNYGYIALIQLQSKHSDGWELSPEDTLNLYDEKAGMVEDLMLRKNHDYGEAWRNMSQESFVDLILTKLHRMRQIIANEGKTLISEGLDANLCDIVNYALFALIHLKFPMS